jgi:hypothetical protein
MNGSPEISRRQLEESGEVLREKESVQRQSTNDQSQTTDWDSLKYVPFRGKQTESFEEGEESEEEEGMSM